jgi:aminoglycoside phosphotransferase (APT) family kinase protein
MTPSQRTIDATLVHRLISSQFPQWKDLSIKPVAHGGHDNRTFHLGDQMLVRMPSAQCYADKVAKEQEWLPFLAPHLSITIPDPIAIGVPGEGYPWNWSIYKWIEGESANALDSAKLNLPLIAKDLAQFLHELHKINTTDVPLVGGPHNFYRGASPKIYDAQTRDAITQLLGIIDTDAATAVWDKATSSEWHRKPVWIHGDLAAGNILIKNGLLTAVIDFGVMGIGDPACDLVIAWTLFKGESREVFQQAVGLDTDTWARARGWALWKALITLAPLEDTMSTEAIKQKHIISELIEEYKSATK